MTVTETAAPAAEETGADAPAVVVTRPSGPAGLFGTADPVGLARMWVVVSLLFLLVAGVTGGLVGVERVDADGITVLDGAVDQVFNLHATAGIFLFLVPIFLGIATAVVPLQVGAATVAFPRAAAAAFWTWLLSGGVLIASYVVDGGPTGADREGRLLWVVGFGGVLVGLLVATVCVLTTIWALRTAGMTLDRTPAFTWTMLVAGSIWLASLPVLLGLLVLSYVEFRYGVGLTADGARLAWAFGVPQVFAYALPALGLLLDAAPVAAGIRQRNHGVLIGAIAAAGLLSFGADMLIAGEDPSIYTDALYVGASFALLLPLLAIAGGVADTLRRGKLNLTSPLLFGVAALLMLLAGAAANALRVIDPLDLIGTTADTSVIHYALGAGAIGAIGALHHWATKVFGVQLAEGVGRAAAAVLLVGTVALALPDIVSGFLDQPVGLRILDPVEDGVEALNAVSVAGGALLLLGVVLVLFNLVGAAARRNRDEPVAADPWGGHTLEWLAASPPDPGGIGPVEPVTSPAPLLDVAEKTEAS